MQRMRRVEQAQLELLVALHLVAEDRAGRLPARSPAGEAVLEHPHAKRLGDDGAASSSSPSSSAARARCSGPRRRHDPVDHRRRKRDLTARSTRAARHRRRRASSATNSSTSARVCSPLRADVVAARRSPSAHRARAGAPAVPARAARSPCSAARRARSARTAARSVSSAPVAGARGVAALGDRQRRDPACRRSASRATTAAGSSAATSSSLWTPTTSGAAARAAQLEDAVQAVLGAHRVDDRARSRRDADDPPRPRLVLQRARGVQRLMGAVEAARARDGRCPPALGRARRDGRDAPARARGATVVRSRSRVTSRASCRRARRLTGRYAAT